MNNELLKLTPELVLFVKKLIQHSRGGLTKDERQELAADLINLLYKVLKELVDTETEEKLRTPILTLDLRAGQH